MSKKTTQTLVETDLGLNPKQKRFCDEYLIDLNATQAAIRAGYSESTANEQGARLLANVSVSAYLQTKKNEAQQKLQMSRDEVLRSLASIARCSIKQVMKWDGYGTYLIPSDEIPDEIAASISEIKTTIREDAEGNRTVTHHVKMHDKQRALEMLAKHLGLFADVTNNTINLNFSSLPKSEIIDLGHEAIKFLESKKEKP